MANTPFQIVGAQGGSVVPLGASDRRHRRPKFKFNLKAKPYAITPFMIAPVLPGETLQSVWHESREVSDTLVDPLIGWKLERYWFYVQIRDLNERDQLEVLFTDPVNGDISALNSAADSKYYHNGGSPNFLKMCLQRVVETYFRDEGETWNTHTIDGYPAAQFRDVQWMDSLLDDTAVDDEGAGIGTVTAGGSLQELQEQLTIFQTLQAMNMTSGTFEDYLRAQGVSFDREKLHYPELIASETEWVYPANTVDPATGSPSSAISHVSKGVKRDRKKFDEPGFVIGVYVPRPKLYYERQFGSVAHCMNTGFLWMNKILQGNPESTLVEYANNAGPLFQTGGVAGTDGPTNGYIFDMRDLLLYGEQFRNHDHNNQVALPAVDLDVKYPTDADINSLFTTTDGTKSYVKSDGFVSLDIKTWLQDHTQRTTEASA